MAKVIITQDYLEDIADAIREKTGLSDTYKPSEMAPAIMTISGGGGIVPSGTTSITSNGTYNVSTYAVADVDVDNSYVASDQGKVVSNGTLVSQSAATYTQNSTYDTTLVNSVTVDIESGGGGSVTQDQDGYIILPSTGGGSGSSGINQDTSLSPSPLEIYIAYPSQKELFCSWDLTSSLTDTVQGRVITLGNSATQDANGITINSVTAYATLPLYFRPYFIYEFDIASMEKKNESGHGRFIMVTPDRGFICRSSADWGAYLNGRWSTNKGTYVSLQGKTLSLVVTNDKPTIYLDGELWYSITEAENLFSTNKMMIGSSGGQSFYDVTISGIRVYRGVW